MLVHKKYLRSPKYKDFAWKETIATKMLKVTPPWQSDDGHAEKGMIWSQYYKTIRDSEVSQNSARITHSILANKRWAQ